MAIDTADGFTRRTPRATLQHRGQFWTPEWVARAMAAYVLQPGVKTIFDPAAGAGALLIAAKRVSGHGRVRVSGVERYQDVLELAKDGGLSEADLSRIRIGSYLDQPALPAADGIICNPPYIRHHRLEEDVKTTRRFELERWLGVKLDGRLGLHGYFFLTSLKSLKAGGRLAYITSADLYEGKSSHAIWSAIAAKFRIDAIVTFDSDATPFPGVDTNPVICLISAGPPRAAYTYVRVLRSETPRLESVLKDIHAVPGCSSDGEIRLEERRLQTCLEFGLARPRFVADGTTVPLGALLTCVRGIATGANDFFFLTTDQVEKRNLPKEFFVRAVGRTRDVPGNEISSHTLDQLDRAGRPTWLLNVHGYSEASLPKSLQEYLGEGVRGGLPARPLLQQRRAWYWTEQRRPAPFLFAYLGRRNVRFIRNRAGVQALTGFLCVYPQPAYSSPHALEALWQCLEQPAFLKHLDLVAKTYGGGALKVEPRALERTPIPIEAIQPILKFHPPQPDIQAEGGALLYVKR